MWPDMVNTEIDYTTNKDGSPYTEMNSSNLYNRLSEDEQLITEDSSDQWDERFEEHMHFALFTQI